MSWVAVACSIPVTASMLGLINNGANTIYVPIRSGPTKLVPLNCKSCGAPMKTFQCDHCGTLHIKTLSG